MSDLAFILLASVFLPLFPASMIFTAVIDNIKPVWLRELLFLLWPVCGLALILVSQIDMAAWLAPLALFTSLLYALRLLTLREVKQWSRFLAISLWSLLWLSLSQQASTALLLAYAVGMTLPLLLLRRLSLGLEQRFGAAYSDLYGGLAHSIPRFAAILTVTALAAIATPLFPAFFIVLDMVISSMTTTPLFALVILLIWLLWSWAGARFIQGFIVGAADAVEMPDLSLPQTYGYALLLSVLVIGGASLAGAIL
jgi:hypothetical protein